MVDIEFMVQCIVMMTAHQYPQILHWTDNVRQIQALAEAKIISDDAAHLLRMAYLTYRSMAHRLSLQEEKPLVDKSRVMDIRPMVQKFWGRMFGDSVENGSGPAQK